MSKRKVMKKGVTLGIVFGLMSMLGVLIAHVSSAGAAERHVYPGGSIQSAIDAASTGDEIIVHEGTYMERINFNGNKAITVRSTDPANPTVVAHTIIDGDEAGSVVTFNGGEGVVSVLSGLTVQNGAAGYGGGGIFCDFSSPSITNCTISGNSAGYEGGGIYCSSSSSPSITNCTISGNRDGDCGGGISCDNSSPIITNCTISGNSAPELGGGIYCRFSSSPIITNCTISGNSAYSGGGIDCRSSSPIITNCTISGNSAYSGGGIDCFHSSSSPIITNCILWNDSSDEVSVGDGATPIITYSDIQGEYVGTGNINADPLFVNPSAGDHHLQSGSPCINKGTNGGAPTTDKDGNPRPLGAGYDMGAYEYVILDHDGDGIVDVVDPAPNEFSNDFSDGKTSGTIINRGDQTLIIKDEADPLGIRIKADPSGGALPAIISGCGGSIISLDAGDEIIITCGSVEVTVVNGTVDITFTSTDGTSTTTRMNTGSSIVFNQGNFTFTAPNTNTEPVIVKVQGKEFSIDPGKTVIISENAYSVPLLSNLMLIIFLAIGVISIMGTHRKFSKKYMG